MRIEEIVNQLVDICILDVVDLRIEHIAYKLGIHIYPNEDLNFYVKQNGIDMIGLKIDSALKMWQAFCHEVGHMMLHVTDQRTMPKMWNDLQEGHANKFAILFMMPESLIHKHKLYDVQSIMNYFNVPQYLAVRRIDLLINYSRVKILNF